jgi:hypothetical protein
LGVKDDRWTRKIVSQLRLKGYVSDPCRLPGRGERLFRRVLLPPHVAAQSKRGNPDELSGKELSGVRQIAPHGGGERLPEAGDLDPVREGDSAPPNNTLNNPMKNNPITAITVVPADGGTGEREAWGRSTERARL